MTITDQDRKKNDERIKNDIREHGCHVISVFDRNEETPSFSYSVGVLDFSDRPEAIVIGLDSSLGCSMINEYSDRVRAGQVFVPGCLYAGFLEGFEIYVEPASSEAMKEYLLGCTRHYGVREFSAVQLIYPTTRGLWPWDEGASEWFRSNQPMLGRDNPSAPLKP